MNTRDEVLACQRFLLLWDRSRCLCPVVLVGCLPSAHPISSQTSLFCKWPHLSPLLTLGETRLFIPSVLALVLQKIELSGSVRPGPLPILPLSLFLLLLVKSLFPRHHSSSTLNVHIQLLWHEPSCCCALRSLPLGKC